jgi:RHS repeat-associated protein
MSFRQNAKRVRNEQHTPRPVTLLRARNQGLAGFLRRTADFTPYGQEISHTERLQTTACPPNYKFTGYEHDTETGLDYAFARYYSSRLGRFLSTDPLGGAVGDLQSHNRYAYVDNNPLNATDPLGLYCYVGQAGCHQGARWAAFGIGFIAFYSEGDVWRILWLPIGPTDSGGAEGQASNFTDRWRKAVSDCVNQLFRVTLTAFTASATGSNGSFTGVGPNGQQLSVTNDVKTFTVAGLNTLTYGSPTPPEGRGDIQGYTAQGPRATKYFWGIGYAYRSFSPSTNYSGSDLSVAAMLGTQVHELGHSLAWMLKLASPNQEDPFGAKMQDCVNQRVAQK